MLLAIETATTRGSVALVGASGVIREAPLPGERDHGRTLASTVEALLDGALPTVEGYAISIGPGSFTGLRVGLAFLKGLALVHMRGAVPVSTLEAIAAGAHAATGAKHVLAVLDARAQEVFAAAWSARAGVLTADSAVQPGLHLAADVSAALAGTATLLAGDGAPLIEAADNRVVADRALWTPSAGQVGALAWPRFTAGEVCEVLDLEPAYHQLPAAVKKKRASVSDPRSAR